jgi:hypothetical protein
MLDHTLNFNLNLNTDKLNDQLLVNYGDNTSQLISLISSKNLNKLLISIHIILHRG